VPEKLYRLTEAAQAIGCSVDVLRWYEESGKIAYRRELGMRVLTLDDISLLRRYRAEAAARRAKKKALQQLEAHP
jgi:DNA-binding transcriptional MerR regulator